MNRNTKEIVLTQLHLACALQNSADAPAFNLPEPTTLSFVYSPGLPQWCPNSTPYKRSALSGEGEQWEQMWKMEHLHNLRRCAQHLRNLTEIQKVGLITPIYREETKIQRYQVTFQRSQDWWARELKFRLDNACCSRQNVCNPPKFICEFLTQRWWL